MTVTITFNHSRSPEGLAEFKAALEQWVRDQSRIEDVEFAWSDVPPEVISGLWAQMEWGDIRLGKNELVVRSTIQHSDTVGDAAGVRIASNTPEPTIGLLSWDSIREDDRHEAVVQVIGKRWEARREFGRHNLFGEIEFFVRDPRVATKDDLQFVRRMKLDPDGVHFYGPVFVNGLKVA